MSNAFRQLARQREEVAQPQNTSRCQANHCPCMGSISLGSDKFYCSAHAFSESEKWPRITEKLHEHDWLIAFHDDIKKMDRKLEDWRAFAMQFWGNQEDAELLQPHPQEEATPYMNRMRGELGYRCNLNKRPSVRLPQAQKARGFGNVARRAAA